MKSIYRSAGVLSLALLVLSGCESVSESVSSSLTSQSLHGGFIAVLPKTHEITTDVRSAYAAALDTAKAIGYHFIGGGPAQGRLELLSQVEQSAALKSAQQVALSLKFSDLGNGQTQVSLLVMRIDETEMGSSAPLKTETQLRDSPIYPAVFAELDRQVKLVATTSK